MRVAYLTTVKHNVGDDFIREGIVYFLKKHLGVFQSTYIHKHQPVTPVPPALNFKGGRKIWKIMKDAYTPVYFNQIMDADLIVQAGAPVYWLDKGNDSSMAEWVKPFWYDRVARIYQQKPVINLAAGACLAYKEGPENVLNHPGLVQFIKDIHRFCALTTVRDTLAHEILNELKLKNYLIPCSSIFAKNSIGVTAQKPEFFFINYMELGGHYTFGQEYDKGIWPKKVLEVCALAKKQFPVRWVCHNLQEIKEVKKLGIEDDEIFYSKSYIDYIEFYSKGVGGLFNRVHGAMMLASYGRRPFVVGSDSRVRMAEQIGIPVEFVGNVPKLNAQEIFNLIVTDTDKFSKDIDNVLKKAETDYDFVIKDMSESRGLRK